MRQVFCRSVHNRNNECICPLQKVYYISIRNELGPIQNYLAIMVDLIHVLDKAHYLTGIAPFIVIETDHLEKVGIHLNALSCVEDGSMRISDEIGRYYFIVHIIQNTGQICHRGFLNFFADFFVRCRFLQSYV